MCITDRFQPVRARQAGISLVELVMFIVIVSVGIVGILKVMDVTTRHSADPLQRKQALSIAESILEEVQLMPFTFCDPNDPNVESATGAIDCGAALDQNKAGGDLTSATPGNETRYGVATPFDNVADYGNFKMSGGIADITGTTVAGLDNYTLQPITITRVAMNNIANNGDALLITVTVTDPAGDDITVQGIRTRYAPTATP